MEIIPHRQVVIDSELIERIMVLPEYIVLPDIYESLHKKPDNINVVLWNWWISN